MELLQKINAKYVYGVSATPKRGDSLDRIIYMLLGPLRHRFTALERAKEQGIGHYFVPRYTRVVDTAESKDNINKAYNLISTSKAVSYTHLSSHLANIRAEIPVEGRKHILHMISCCSRDKVYKENSVWI